MPRSRADKWTQPAEYVKIVSMASSESNVTKPGTDSAERTPEKAPKDKRRDDGDQR